MATIRPARRKARGMLVEGPGARRDVRATSGAGELRAALLGERGDALHEVAGGRHLLLDARLELELVVHPAVQPPVELALRAGVGAGRALGQLLSQRTDLGLEGIVWDDPVDEAPLERLRRVDALAERGHLDRPGEADPRGHE